MPKMEEDLDDEKNTAGEKKSQQFICYLNLATMGKCTYGSSCKYEHTQLLYVWKILSLVKKDEKLKTNRYSIATRTLSKTDAEKLEKAYCDVQYENNTFKTRYFAFFTIIFFSKKTYKIESFYSICNQLQMCKIF